MNDLGPAARAAEQPIPRRHEPAGWRGVAIHECGEPLVALGPYAPERIAVDARYHAAGYPGALAECYARATVAHRLAEAATQLPGGWRLVVWDAWRPLAVQQHLFDGYVAALRRKQPAVHEQHLRELA